MSHGKAVFTGLAALAIAGTSIGTPSQARPSAFVHEWVAFGFLPYYRARVAADRDLRIALTEAGLVPDALTAAGLSPEQVASAVASVRAAIQNGLELPSVSSASLRSLQTSLCAVQDRARRGMASDDELQQIESLRGRVAAAAAAHEAALTAVRAASGLNAQVIASLVLIQANRGSQLPVEYLADSRGEADMVALREALTQKGQGGDTGDTPEAAHRTMLAADGLPGSATAKTNAQTNGLLNDSAWRAAIGP